MNVHSSGITRLRRLFARPWIIIAVVTVVTLFFAIQLPRIQIDNEVTAFIPADHPDRLELERVDDVFGADMAFSVGIEVPGGTVFTSETITMIDDLTGRMEQLESVDTVTSLSNLEIIEGTQDGMVVVPLLDGQPGETARIQLLKERLLSWDLYRGLFVSDDFTSTQIVLTHDLSLDVAGREALLLEIRSMLAEYDSPLLNFYVAGEPVITLIISQNTRTDVAILVPLVVLVVIAVLFLVFRRVGGVILPLLTVVVSVVSTLGLMVLLDVALTLVSTVIPVLLVAVGSAYGIHLINHYYHDLAAAEGGNGASGMDHDTHRDLVMEVLLQVGKPVLLAGVTTVVGFASLLTSSVAPMRTFGLFTAVGVLIAVVVALLLTPALLLVRHNVKPVDGRERARIKHQDKQRMYLEGLFDYFTASKTRILIATVLIVIIAVVGATRLIVDNDMVQYFKEDTDIRRSDEFLREQFAGTRTFSIVVAGEEKGDLTNPDVLVAMDQLANRLRQNPDVGSVVSYADFIKRMNQVMNVDAAATGPEPWGDEHGYGTSYASDVSGAPDTSDAGGAGFVAAGPAADASASNEWSGDAGFAAEGFVADAPADGFAAEGFVADAPADGLVVEGFAADGFAADGFAGDQFAGDQFGGDNDSSWGFGADLSSVSSGAWGASEPEPVASGSQEYGDLAGLLNRAYYSADRADISATDLLELVNRELNYRGQAYYEIPYDLSKYPAETREELGNLITQYLLLYSGSLDDFADDALEPARARMRVQLRSTSSRAVAPLVEEITTSAAALFPPGYTVTVAGIAVVESAVTNLITDAQIRSIAVSLSLVFIIVAITFRSLVAGLYGILPLGLTLLVNFAIMGFAGITLDVATAMVSSVAIGIGIDYTIHFLSGYKRERLRHETVAEAEKATLRTTGRAITFNAVSVAAGFAVLIFSRFNPLMNMGILISLTMLTSSTASMTILPVLLDLFRPRFITK